MFATIAIVIAVLLAALLGYAATLPGTFQVKRSQNILAGPERIFPLIEDFHNWPSWSPFEKLDSAMTKTYSGSARGKGAVYGWTGNNKAGEGRMEIVEAQTPSLVRIKLDFLKPFEAHNTAEFTLEQKDASTNVTWAMYGARPYMFKVMSVFFSMDKMVGKDFAAGLASMRAIVETKQSFRAVGE